MKAQPPYSGSHSVLFLTAEQGIGGTQRIALSLARQFAERGWGVRSLFPQSDNDATLLTWCREQGAVAETHPAVLHIASAHTTRHVIALCHLIRSSHPDIVNIHYGGNFMSLKDILAIRLAGRYRCVVSIHHPLSWSSVNSRKRWMTRIAASLSHAVVVHSQATRKVLLEAGIPARKIQIIPCGVRVPDRSPDRATVRSRLGIPDDAFVVASLSRLVPHKGLADLIDAVALIPDPARKIWVLIAGDGPERSHLQDRAMAQLGARALFLGQVPDTTDLYAAADVFVLPSYLEGFGLVYVEAAFFGIPSIGTRVGGIPDTVLDGQTGLLVPPGDPQALAAAVKRLRDDPDLRQRLGAAARARAYAEFTERRMAERYARVFAEPARETDAWIGM